MTSGVPLWRVWEVLEAARAFAVADRALDNAFWDERLWDVERQAKRALFRAVDAAVEGKP